MNWTETNIGTIATKRLFYFDKDLNVTCTRICRQLNIEVFPSYDGQTFFKFDGANGTWTEMETTQEQKIDSEVKIFSSKESSEESTHSDILKKFDNSTSQILFVFEQNIFLGIVHFTDYAKKVVYQDLYKNYFEFEKKLRELLIIKGYKTDSFKDYFQFKADKYPRDKDFYIQKKNVLESENENYPLDNLLITDLLEFCYSSYHKKKQAILNIGDYEKTTIGKLRNIVMHNKDNTGSTSSSMPHNFSTFKKDFFIPVQTFKKIFMELKYQVEKYNVQQKPVLNKIWLSNLDKLSDSDLRRQFFDYEKYI